MQVLQADRLEVVCGGFFQGEELDLVTEFLENSLEITALILELDMVGKSLSHFEAFERVYDRIVQKFNSGTLEVLTPLDKSNIKRYLTLIN